MLKKFNTIYREFPRNFWVLMSAAFIDRLGGALIFPFLALYVTQRFNVGMIEVGKLFALYAVASLVGNIFGGALTDKFGRKVMIIFGLAASALSSVLMGFVGQLSLFYSLAILVGLLESAGSPAQQAMIADMLPEEKRTQGFGIWRVVANLAATIGPAIGGVLAGISYLLLFLIDAVTSIIMAIIVSVMLPETNPDLTEGQTEARLSDTLKGYIKVVRDRLFMSFMIISILSIVVYMQMNSTLPVYLRDFHGVPPQGYGYLVSLNAGMVVLLQFWFTRKTSTKAPMLMMALGTVFYAVGFGLFGFISHYALFMLAMILITIGEMIVSPIGSALVAKFSPEDMRGRYLAVYSIAWGIPIAIGPLAAGIIMDKYDPNWVWYGSGIVSMIAVIGFLSLRTHARRRFSEIR